MQALPDHYPFADATRQEILAWVDAAELPAKRMFEALPWYSTEQQLAWYLAGIREALGNPELSDAVDRVSGFAWREQGKPQ